MNRESKVRMLSRVKDLEDKVNKEKDKINRDMADRWEYLSALEVEVKTLKKELVKEEGMIHA